MDAKTSESGEAPEAAPETQTEPADKRDVIVRFAGDSGDGIQLIGLEFAKAAAAHGADFMTFPDFPAEIRAPAGSVFGVSAYQIHFGRPRILTPGDAPDVLVAFNPAALKTNLQFLKPGGTLVVDTGAFDKRGLKKAGYEQDPLQEGNELAGYNLIEIDISKRTLEAVEPMDLGRKQGLRSKNFWALGLVCWFFHGDLGPTESWLNAKFKKTPDIGKANIAALRAGHAYGETMELAAFPSLAEDYGGADGKRIISGTEAMALGVRAAAALSGRDVLYCSYPITPASALLHALARTGPGVRTFQAEDEIAAVCAAIGSSYAGTLGISASSGPGIALKTEAMGLAVAAELPLVVINVQRAGPSTGMPTKPEQSDLTMAIHGRHGESPCPVLAPATPSECFDIMIDAADMAISAMTPVIVLSDAYLANAAQRWKGVDVDALPDIGRESPGPVDGDGDGALMARDEATLTKPWVVPGTEGAAFRVGGLEKSAETGDISYDPRNHDSMTRLRADKIERIAARRAPVTIETGADSGKLLVVAWGSTHGAVKRAVLNLSRAGREIGHVHLRQLWPLPRGLDEMFARFERIVAVEMNSGQLRSILRDAYLAPVEGINWVSGQPFKVADLQREFETML